ncbi:MAG: SpoIIE family protein phosphatase [Archangium sp.]
MKYSTARLSRPLEGSSACGDVVVEEHAGDWHLFAVVDALGHGLEAEASARLASEAIALSRGKPLPEVFEAVHRALRGRRGVVMSAILVDGAQASFAGIGNVEIFTPEGVARPVTLAGTLGGGAYRFRSFALTLWPGQRWVLASDGVKTREASAMLARLRREPPQAVAAAILGQATRVHDDASLLILDVEAL